MDVSAVSIDKIASQQDNVMKTSVFFTSIGNDLGSQNVEHIVPDHSEIRHSKFQVNKSSELGDGGDEAKIKKSNELNNNHQTYTLAIKNKSYEAEINSGARQDRQEQLPEHKKGMHEFILSIKMTL